MKNLGILVLGILIGYYLFYSTNIPEKLIVTRKIKQTNTTPLKVNETRYHGEETAPVKIESTPAPIVNIKVEPVIKDKRSESAEVHLPKNKKSNLIPNKIKSDIGFKTYLGLNHAPFLAVTDTRILNLKGNYVGKYVGFLDNRTGRFEKAILKITEKETSLNVIDSYDNPNDELTFKIDTARAFKVVPGDENLLVLIWKEGPSIIFNLRTSPNLEGKTYNLNSVTGLLDFKKKKDGEK